MICKYKVGDTVRALFNPSVTMVVRSARKGIYYCFLPENPSIDETVYFEPELMLVQLSTGYHFQ